MSEKRRYCVMFPADKIIIKGISPKAREAACDIFKGEYRFISPRLAREIHYTSGYKMYECDSKGNLYYSYPDKPITVDFYSSYPENPENIIKQIKE